jgi:hypothetical protein
MADITGNTGSITLPTDIKGTVLEFSAEVTVAEIEIPPGFSELWTGADGGAMRVRGTVRAKMPDTAKFMDMSAMAKFKGTVTLTYASTRTISGAALFTNIRWGLSRGGFCEMTANFVNTSTDFAAA